MAPITIHVGGNLCKIKSGPSLQATAAGATDRVICTVAHMKAGQYYPVLISDSVGLASIGDGVAKVDYQLVVAQTTPAGGGVRGGDTLVLNGTGFSDVVHENSILVGGGACYPTASSFTSVTCRIPFSHPATGTLDALCHGGGAPPCAAPPQPVPRAVTITQQGLGFDWAVSSGTRLEQARQYFSGGYFS